MSGIIVGFSLSSLTNEMRVHGGGRLASLILSAACYRTNPNFKLALLQLVCQFLMHHSINHQLVLKQRFSIPVLAPPPSVYFVCYSYASDVCSIRTQVPCEVYITVYSAMIPVRNERIYTIQSALKCAGRELKCYIFTEVYDVTLVRAWRRCAAQIHEWMFWNEVNFSGFPLLRE